MHPGAPEEQKAHPGASGDQAWQRQSPETPSVNFEDVVAFASERGMTGWALMDSHFEQEHLDLLVQCLAAAKSAHPGDHFEQASALIRTLEEAGMLA